MSIYSVSRAASEEDITISANTTWSAGTYTYRDITISNNATLTLSGTYSNDTNGTGVTINARSVNVQAGAKISANGTGYGAGAGTGKGTGSYGSGAGYGGTGAPGETGTAGGISYGSAVAPVDLGSGGGNNGGAGGGAIRMNLSGNLVADGIISANGNNGSMWKGSGSGGSIYINAVDVSGSGTISANGGTYTAAQGGGGRIALYYTGNCSLDTTKITASKGSGTVATDGSVFILDKANKDLTISKSIILNPSTGIDSNGDPAANGIFNLRNLTINTNSSLIAASKYTTDTDGSGLEFKLTGNLTVDSGSKIDAKGQGYAKNLGEGKGIANANLYGGGGAHGGNGGRAEVGLGGTKYDTTLFPSKLGSGGATTRGGSGGGIIKVSAQDIIVNGSLDASATAPTTDGATNGAGAAGGSIYLSADSLAGSGTILANASNGTGYSGGGGGGRIAIYSDTSAFNPDNITATKGLKGGSGASADGEVGTVFLYDTASGNVTASSDVTFYANQGINRDGTTRTDGVFYFNSLNVTNNATVTIGGTYTNENDGRGVTINLDGNLTVDSGSKITANGQGYSGNSGPGKGTGGASTSGSGGSYGGVGGKSYNNNLAPAIYGNLIANYPYFLGSGGANGEGGVGGKGGGAVTLRVLGSITNNGEISADGASGTGGTSSWRPGGGSGGSVFLVSDSLAGSGYVYARGGAGLGDANFGSGGGGGGRISVVYSSSQNLPLGNFSSAGGAGGGAVAAREGAEGSVNITQKILPAAEFSLKNPNNNSTEFTNTENVEIVPTDETVEKYKEVAPPSELVPTFYADGWANVVDGKDVGASEGTKTVRAWFKDGNELISSSIGTATITLDTTNPELQILNNNQTVDRSTATINLNLSDNLSGIDYVMVRGERISVANLKKIGSSGKSLGLKAYADETTFQTTVSLEIGSNEFPVIAYDKAGNSSTINFIATRSAPAATATPSVSKSVSSSQNSNVSVSSGSVGLGSSVTPTDETSLAQSLDEKIVALKEEIANKTDKITSPDNYQANNQDLSTFNRFKYYIVGLFVVVIGLVFYIRAKH